METPRPDVTGLLRRWSDGDPDALESLMPLVYGELRALAGKYFRSERPGHTLQPTALVHEAFLRLIGQNRLEWQNRAHFFGIAAQLMRRILVDHARRRAAAKRNGGTVRVDLGEPASTGTDRDPEILSLDQALTSLEALDPRQAKIVELRFFGGLTVEETAHVAGTSTATVKREWRSPSIPESRGDS